ncbi:MAG: hypothetical protein R3A78_07250 [Polyangiales bacterium]|nr:hypothetical protein [Myxococcales bacterium]
MFIWTGKKRNERKRKGAKNKAKHAAKNRRRINRMQKRKLSSRAGRAGN